MDVLRESSWIQDIMSGGIEQAIELGRRERLRHEILSSIGLGLKQKFGSEGLPSMETIYECEDLELLMATFERLKTAETLDEVRQIYSELVDRTGQFRIKKPKDPQIDGWKLVPKENSSQEPVLLVRQQSGFQLWRTYSLDCGVYDVYLFIKDQPVSVRVGQVEVKENQTTEFDTRR